MLSLCQKARKSQQNGFRDKTAYVWALDYRWRSFAIDDRRSRGRATYAGLNTNTTSFIIAQSKVVWIYVVYQTQAITSWPRSIISKRADDLNWVRTLALRSSVRNMFIWVDINFATGFQKFLFALFLFVHEYLEKRQNIAIFLLAENRFFLGISPKQRTPATDPYGLGLR